MNKKAKIVFFVAVFLLYSSLFFAQNFTIKQIDSVNNLPFNKKIENLISSEKIFLQTLALSQKHNYQLGIAESYENLGLIYYYQGEYELNQKYSLLAIKEYRNQNLLNKEAKAYAEYGYEMKRRNLKDAFQYMQKGLKLAEDNNFKHELKAIYDNYGYLKEMNKENDSAFYFYNKSLQLKRKTNDSVGIPYSLNKIANLQIELNKELSNAKKQLDEAYTIRLKIDDKIGIAENLNFYGSYYYKVKDYEQSTYYFNEALAYSTKHNYTYLTQDNFQKLAEVHETQNNFKEALNYFKKHIVYKDSIANINLRVKQAELDTKFDTEEKERQILLQRAQIAEKNVYVILVVGLLLLSILIGYFLYSKQRLKTAQIQKENELKSALQVIETQNKLQEQRLKISRDLHDNIGSQLTFIISSIDNLKFALSNQNPKIDEKLSNISTFTKGTIVELRDTIWAMNKEAITVEDLKTRISNFIENANNSLQRIDFSFNCHLLENSNISFASQKGMNIYRIIQEAVNNAIKHAEASKIEVNLSEKTQHFEFEIKDNGKGFSLTETEAGNGLNSMQKRAAELQADFQINQLEKGTKIFFTISK